ncbi:hypothetical protein KDL29_11690 [bacterium]|nr:hypothetical protein [bacterium]
MGYYAQKPPSWMDENSQEMPKRTSAGRSGIDPDGWCCSLAADGCLIASCITFPCSLPLMLAVLLLVLAGCGMAS